MAILAMMMNDDIKASAVYSKYLAKSKGSKLIKASGKGKGLLTKQGVKVALERVSIPKRRRSKIVVEEISQFEEVPDKADSKETGQDNEEPLVRRRPIGVVISGEARKESDEEGKARKASKDDFFIQQHPRNSGEGSGVIPNVPGELIHKSSNKGSGVNPAVLDEPRDRSSSSSSASEDEIEDISIDEEDKRKDDKEKVDES
uniref:Uncharacterized protein n=1 Tax=Tanacetum cinerariifolium TaxID=118510 RepID=A0A6L2P5Q5_TANCI|nr:hypothetical protein [Tanacetum cinerariifolium]